MALDTTGQGQALGAHPATARLVLQVTLAWPTFEALVARSSRAELKAIVSSWAGLVSASVSSPASRE